MIKENYLVAVATLLLPAVDSSWMQTSIAPKVGNEISHSIKRRKMLCAR